MPRDSAQDLLPSRLGDGPKGRRLREILEGLVAELAPGSALPSERLLAERYGVARMTVRGETDRLTAEGVTYRVHGRGTFVAAPRVAQAGTLSSFTEDMRARGLAPGSRVLARELVPASKALALRLELAPSTPVLRVDRVRTADGSPLAVEEAYVPASRYPGIDEADFSDASLFDLLARNWDVRLRDADQRVVAVTIDAEAATVLDVAAGSAGLRFQTLAWDVDGTPVYFALSLYRGDRYEIDLRQLRES
ncbi:MAG TPA: GntR family transcriptional regulator [Solirubrobacteraceae bacterium]|nr:GntR family transcriptional regulator [Solirubrobacteraceae bacterium]